jgi:hypothetical protein
MKRTIYDCWNCRHHNSDNPYGIDYCEVHDTRCSFAHDDCDDFEPTDSGNERQPQPPRRLTVIIWYLEIIAVAAILGWLLMGCTTTRYVPVTETHTEHHWHTDTVKERDSTHTERETVIREVDSAAMARYGIQMQANQRAWLVLQREMENRLRELEHMTANKDTVRDSIPVPYPVTEYVERKRSTLEWGLLIIGVAALIGGIVWAIFKIKHLLFSVKY